MAGGNANLYTHFGNQNSSFSEKWKSTLSQDKAIPLWATYYVQSYIRDICSTMFIAALFVIARNKVLLNQRMDKENVVNLHNGVLFSSEKK